MFGLFSQLLVFDFFIYQPHRNLEEIKKEKLLNDSIYLTDYHGKLYHSIIKERRAQIGAIKIKSKTFFLDEFELFEISEKLIKIVEDIHTWPIPKRTFQKIVIFINPLLPMLLPIIGSFIIQTK
jgi:hypothetical protein